MSDHKKEITEQAASAYFVLSKIEKVQDRWNEITNELKEITTLIQKEKEAAVLDFALAAIAIDVQTVRTHFKEKESDRIEKEVFRCLNIGALGGYNINALAMYTAAFKHAEETNNEDPLNAIANILIHDLLGTNITKFADPETKIVSPFLILTIAGLLTPFTGYWEKLNEDYTLIKGKEESLAKNDN